MMKIEKLSFELLGYKIRDIQAGRKLEGGLEEAWELYDFLLKNSTAFNKTQLSQLTKYGEILAAQLAFSKANKEDRRQKIEEKDSFEKLMNESFPDLQKSSFDKEKILTNVNPMLINSKPVADIDFDESINWMDSQPETKALTEDPDFKEEQAILQNLAMKLWCYDLEDSLQSLAIHYRLEPHLVTARVIYALTRNFEHYSNQKSYDEDVELSHFVPVFAITDENDPLVVLDDLETLKELLKRLITMIINLSQDQGQYVQLKIPASRSLEYFERMALKIAANPVVDSISSGKKRNVSSRDVKLAIEDLKSNKAVSIEERKRQLVVLDKRFRQLREKEIRQSKQKANESKYYSRAVRTFFGKIKTFVLKKYGGLADSPRLEGGVLFAKNPILKIDTISQEANAVTIRVRGPMRFKLAGIDMALMGSGKHMMIFVGDQDYPLKQQVNMNAMGKSILGLFENNYLHLRLSVESLSLSEQLARGLVLLRALSSERSNDILQVLKAIGLSANNEPAAIVEAAINRFKLFSEKALNARSLVEGLIKGAASSRGIELPENEILTIVQAILISISSKSKDFDIVLESSSHSEIKILEMSSDSLNLYIDNQDIGLRKYRSSIHPEHIAVLSVNRLLGSFSNVMIKSFSDGAIMFVRHGNDIAVLYFDKIMVPG